MENNPSVVELTRENFLEYLKNNPEVLISAVIAVQTGVRNGDFPVGEVDPNIIDVFVAMAEMISSVKEQEFAYKEMISHDLLNEKFLDFLSIDVILDYLWEALKKANSN